MMKKSRILALYILIVAVFGCSIWLLSYSLFSSQNNEEYYRQLSFTPRKKKYINDYDFHNPARLTNETSRNCTQEIRYIVKPPDPLIADRRANTESGPRPVTSLAFSNLSFVSLPLHWANIDATRTTVFSAYYDQREEIHGPSVVILGYQSKDHEGKSLHCLFKYGDGTFSCRDSSVYREMDKCNGQKEYLKKKAYKYKHVFHVCKMDVGEVVPIEVALSSRSNCNPSGRFLPVNQERPAVKADIGVCVQTPIFKRELSHIVEFVEMQKLFGAQYFTMYFLDIWEELETKLKDLYGNQLEIVHWSNSFKEAEPLHYYGEILAIQDCLYRNMHRTRYLVMIDLDEIIVSKRHSSWMEMLTEFDQSYVDSFVFINTLYLPTAPKDLPAEYPEWTSRLCKGHKLPTYYNHFNRAKCRFHYYERSKVILKPQHIIDMDIHGVCTRMRGKGHFFVPDDMANSHHYREKPTVECKKNRRKKTYDTTFDDHMKKYANVFLKAVSDKLCRHH